VRTHLKVTDHLGQVVVDQDVDDVEVSPQSVTWLIGEDQHELSTIEIGSSDLVRIELTRAESIATFRSEPTEMGELD
jgi:hypothetical protein